MRMYLEFSLAQIYGQDIPQLKRRDLDIIKTRSQVPICPRTVAMALWEYEDVDRLRGLGSDKLARSDWLMSRANKRASMTCSRS